MQRKISYVTINRRALSYLVKLKAYCGYQLKKGIYLEYLFLNYSKMKLLYGKMFKKWCLNVIISNYGKNFNY